jgi:nucleoside-diphosphate-sugar epimerase
MLDLSGIENLGITGANGFVGKSIAELISSLSNEKLPQKITFITRKGLNFQLEESVKGRSVDINQDLTEPWMFAKNISHFLNLAADGSRKPYEIEACQNFSKISSNLVQWLEGVDFKMQIFHASSGACFGPQPLFGRQNSENRKEFFMKNRIEVESYLVQWVPSMNHALSIGRLFSFSGKNILEKSHYALSNFIQSSLTTNRIQVVGDPLTQRSYLHQNAMSEWILKALTNPIPYTDLQIGSSEALTLKELAEFVAKSTGADLEFSSNPESGDIYIPHNADTRIKLGVDEGMGWKAAALEMINEARMSIDAN